MTEQIVVVGAGGAGLAAAVAAVDAGASVILLERNTSLGGTFHFSGGTYATGNSRVTDAAGTGDSADKHFADVIEISRGTVNRDLVRAIVDGSGPTLDWLMQNGLQLTSDTPVALSDRRPGAVPRTYMAKGGGSAFIIVLEAMLQWHILAGRVTLVRGGRMKGLLAADGRVKGIVTEAPGSGGEECTYEGPVVLATGGYGGSQEMVARINPGFENAVTMCPAHADGSGLAAALELGAVLVNDDAPRLYPGAIPGKSGGWRVPARSFLVRLAPGPEKVSMPGSIWVTSRGERVLNEDTSDVLAIEHLFSSMPDKTVHVLFDHAARLGMAQCPVRAWDWDKLESTGRLADDRRIGVGSDLRALAAKAGIEADALDRTVDRWNQALARGQDEVFGRVVGASIERPPFYLISTKGCFMGTSAGIAVDAECRVLNSQGDPIAGLYAVGEIQGGAQYMGKGGIVSGFGDVAPLALGRRVGERLGRAAIGR